MAIAAIKLDGVLVLYRLTPVDPNRPAFLPPPQDVKDGSAWSSGGSSISKDQASEALKTHKLKAHFFDRAVKLSPSDRELVFQIFTDWLAGRLAKTVYQ